MNRLVFLKSVSLFTGLTLENLMAVDTVLTRETFLADEAIITEGTPGDHMYIVFTGEVRVHKKQAAGDSELARLGAGQMFGEMSLFDDQPRSATVSAVGEAEVLSLDRERFLSLVHQRPQILMEVCKVLVQRLRTAIS